MAKQPRSCATHDGSFHADETCALALLLLFNQIDRDKIVRSRDPADHARCEFVCDVGGFFDPAQKLFDHHQADYQGSLSSAGMVLQWLRDQKIITPREYQFFNDSLVRGVDDHDNGRAVTGVGVCSFSHIISNFSPIEHDASPEEENKAFFAAFDFTLGHLQRLHQRFRYIQECRDLVQEAMQKHKDCLFFKKSIPWQDNFFDLGGESHPASFVIMPSGKHWKLRGIPPSGSERMKVRLPLPAAWAGLIGDQLKSVCHIDGAVFCHKGRFISVWESYESALAALKETLKSHGRKTLEGESL